MTEQETKRWTELSATYQQCLQVAIETWGTHIGLASMAQQRLAEEMRDRRIDVGEPERITLPHDIPVPLFTPRDRLQFLKEATTAIFIEAGKRGLNVTTPVPVEPNRVPFGEKQFLTDLTADELAKKIAWALERPDRSAKFADFIVAAQEELDQRAAKTDAIKAQDLSEKPLTLTEDPPL